MTQIQHSCADFGIEAFSGAAANIATDTLCSPLLPFVKSDGREVRLKSEVLQPTGSFKIRCGVNALMSTLARSPEEVRRRGVATASAGNFAQGLALGARRRNIPVSVHVPDTAAEVKLRAVQALGARIVRHSFDDWWQIMGTRVTGADDGVFIHPVADPAVMSGNGTIALELLAQWPQLDTVVVPFGGGGLIAGIAMALRAKRAAVRVIACEAETSTPLRAAFEAGRPVRVERLPSFVDGIGSHSVLEEMWPLLKDLVDDVVVVSTAAIRDAIRTLVRQAHLVVEGAGGAALAAALSMKSGGRNVVAVLSGGNIDAARLAEILTENEEK